METHKSRNVVENASSDRERGDGGREEEDIVNERHIAPTNEREERERERERRVPLRPKSFASAVVSPRADKKNPLCVRAGDEVLRQTMDVVKNVIQTIRPFSLLRKCVSFPLLCAFNNCNDL